MYIFYTDFFIIVLFTFGCNRLIAMTMMMMEATILLAQPMPLCGN